LSGIPAEHFRDAASQQKADICDLPPELDGVFGVIIDQKLSAPDTYRIMLGPYHDLTGFIAQDSIMVVNAEFRVPTQTDIGNPEYHVLGKLKGICNMFGSILVLCNHVTLYEAQKLYYDCRLIYFRTTAHPGSFMIRLMIDDAKASVYLLEQYHAHQLVRECHRRKTEFIISPL
jgi:hypothetical protein